MKTVVRSKTLLIGLIACVLGVSSVAEAGRNDRHRGDDRYSRQRYEASMRYERGSRNYEKTYVRYGQENYFRRPSYDRDYVRGVDRGTYYVNGKARRSTWGIGVGYTWNNGYAGDSVALGFYYSKRPAVAYRYPSYYCAPDVYESRSVCYPTPRCDADYYEVRAYSTPYAYTPRPSGWGYVYSARAYYRR